MFEDYPFPVVTLVHNASVTDFLIHEVSCYALFFTCQSNSELALSRIYELRLLTEPKLRLSKLSLQIVHLLLDNNKLLNIE